MDSELADTIARWRLEDPLAYWCIETLASRRTVKYLQEYYFDDADCIVLDPCAIQTALFPFTAAEQAQRVAPATTTSTSLPAERYSTVQRRPFAKPKGRTVTALQRHPLCAVKAAAPPQGWQVSITRSVARQIAAYCLGRPHAEWSALALVDSYFTVGQTGRYVIRELFFCDAGEDTGGHSCIPAAWELKLIDRLITEGREDAIAKLYGHIHSHNTMGAFWSQQDTLMVGQRLDDQSADRQRPYGTAVSVVVTNDLTARARLDWFIRDGKTLAYGTFDPVPLSLTHPKLVGVKDVLHARQTLERPMYAPYQHWGRTLWSEDEEIWRYQRQLEGLDV